MTIEDARMKLASEKAFRLFGLKVSRIDPELEQLFEASPPDYQIINGVRVYLPTGDSAITNLSKKLFAFFGLRVSRINAEVDHLNLVEALPLDLQIIRMVRPYTMTSPARIWALVNAIQYVSENRIKGDICECGVWRGGSSMAAALKLKSARDFRKLWLYDTFAGMSEPTEHDKVIAGAVPAHNAWKKHQRGDHLNEWCFAPLDHVRHNMKSTGYPLDQTTFVVGKVEQTLTVPSNVPGAIALLRLDTDWYESTKAELETLYDKLSPGGVLIIDDYGHWDGARRAVDEFFASRPRKILLDRIDQGGRIGVKVE